MDGAPLLDALFAHAHAGLAEWDRELRFVRVNERLAEINGLSAREHLGRRIEEVLPGLGVELSRRLRAVMLSGRAVTNVELAGRTPADPERERRWLATYFPIRDAAGHVTGVGGIVEETTERHRAERERDELLERERRQATRAAFLARAGAVLAGSLDFEQTLQNVATLAVPALADWAFVEMLQRDGSIRRVAMAHADPSKWKLMREFDRRYPLDPDAPEGSAKVIRTGRSELMREIPPELLERVAIDGGHLETLRSLGFRSHLIVPLRARGRVLGDIALATAESGRIYDEDDLAMAEELALRCALAVDNARLFTEASYVADTLQRSLLPERLPRIEGIEAAVRYRAATEGIEVGGDFYDLFALPGGAAGVAIGDVAGKGVDAAAVTALARHTLRAAAVERRSPVEVLRSLNAALLAELPHRRYLTAAYARLELGQQIRLRVALGGHPIPFILRADGTVDPGGAAGTLLGFADSPRLVERECVLRGGDAIVFYTDGVTEARSSDRFLGEAGLIELLSSCRGESAEAIAERIMSGVTAFERAPHDDIALLVLRAG